VEERFRSLEHKRYWFKENVKKVKAEHLYNSPGQDEWSYASVIEHLVIVEREILSAKNLGASKHSLKEKFMFYMVGGVMTFGIKVPVPTEKVIPTGKKTLEALFDEWAEIRPRLFSFLEEDNDCAILKHPILGLCNRSETAWFLDKHLLYHQVRAARVFKLR